MGVRAAIPRHNSPTKARVARGYGIWKGMEAGWQGDNRLHYYYSVFHISLSGTSTTYEVFDLLHTLRRDCENVRQRYGLFRFRLSLLLPALEAYALHAFAINHLGALDRSFDYLVTPSLP